MNEGLKFYFEHQKINCIINGPWSFISSTKDKVREQGFRWEPNSKIWFFELPEDYEHRKKIIQVLYEYFITYFKSFTNLNDWKEIANEVKFQYESKPIEISLTPTNLPTTIYDKLMPHQKTSIIRFNQQGNKLLMGFDMGTGKTLAALAIAKYYGKKAVIVVPKSLITQWQVEMFKWGFTTPEKVFVLTDNKEFNIQYLSGRYDYIIFNYEKIRYLEKTEVDSKTGKVNWSPYEKELFNLFKRLDHPNYVLIYDETYKIKNYKAALFKAHKKFKSLNWFGVVGLSGTPMENSLYEFYTILNFISPNTITYQDMENHFVFRTGWGAPIYRNLELFNKMASKTMYRVTMADVKSDLPKLTQEYRFVESSKEAKTMKLNLISGFSNLFEIYTTLRVLDSYMDPNPESKYFDMLKPSEHKEKLDELLGILGEIGDNQLLVFTSYEKTAKWLKSKLIAAGYKVEYVSSDVKNKDEIKDKFVKGEIKIVIATDTWAYGIDLPTINYLVNWDLLPNPMKMAQRIKRIYRINSENPKFIVSLVSDIIELDIYEIIKSKLEKIETAVEGIPEKIVMSTIAAKWGIKMAMDRKDEEELDKEEAQEAIKF